MRGPSITIGVIANVRVTGVAGGNVPFPACDAVMEHWPTATRTTVAPFKVQTLAGLAAKLTGKPDEAVALTVNGSVSSARSGKAAKVMLWVLREMLNVRCTIGAGE